MRGIYRFPAAEGAVREHYLAVLAQWPVPCEHLRLPTCQGETFVVACGPADAPPLLLLQGSGANAAMWLGHVAPWAAHFRVYAVDVIGEPGLSAPSRPPLASDAYALWLDDVLRGLGLESAAMVGVSLGGWLVLDYATRHPERVHSAVLLCPSGVGRQRASFLFKAVPLLLLGRRGGRRILRLLAGDVVASPTPPSAAASALADLFWLIQVYFRPRRGKVPIFHDEALARLTMPVLLVAGGRDPLLDTAGTERRLRANLRRLTVRVLPEARHLLPGQAQPILDFLLQAGSTRLT